MDTRRLGSRSSTAFTKLVLPAPEGAAITNNEPRRLSLIEGSPSGSSAACGDSLFDRRDGPKGRYANSCATATTTGTLTTSRDAHAPGQSELVVHDIAGLAAQALPTAHQGHQVRRGDRRCWFRR